MCPLMNEKDTEFECCLAVALTKIPRGSETETAIAVHYTYTVFVYGHIQGVGVTAYRIYYIVKLERWGQMLQIIGNSWKKQPKQ